MPNLVQDPSFESELWSLGGSPGPATHASYTTDHQRTGLQALELVHEVRPPGGPDFGHATSRIIPVIDPGETKSVTFTANQSGVFAFYCTNFCSALHQEMQGYFLVK